MNLGVKYTVILAKYDRVGVKTRNILVITLLLLGGIVVSIYDQALYLHLHVASWDSDWRLYDWVSELRTVGYVPLWISFALLIDGMVAWKNAPYQQATGLPEQKRGCSLPLVPKFPGLLIVLGAAGGGLWAEVLKGVIRRHRPSDVNNGTYVYDWFSGPVADRGLGLASSHAGVAFGAAFIILMISPRAGVVAIILAIGCSMTRLLAGAHFVSDVYVAMILSWVWAKVVWYLWEQNRRAV
jgi:membrane-associated phospholipid phosphatase